MRNQVFKKLFSVLLTLIMVAGLLPASVLAEGEGNADSTPAPTEAVQPTESAEPTTPTETETPEVTEIPEPTPENPAATVEPTQGEPTAKPTDEGIMPANVMPVQANVELQYRIVHLDCGRKYFSKDWIIALMYEAKAAGYNQVQLAFGNKGLRFLLDDMSVNTYEKQAVTDAIKEGNKAYYNAGEKNELTEAEMDEIFVAADKIGIEIVPLFNTPFHMEAVITAMGKLNITNAYYDSNKACLNLSNNYATAFVKALMQKYITYFQGKGCKYFNFGADEYTGGWNSTFYNYANEIVSMISAAGMNARIFNDSFRSDSNNGYVNNAQVCYWSSNSGYASTATVYNYAKKIINTNQDFYYVVNKDTQQSTWSPNSYYAFSGSFDETTWVNYAKNFSNTTYKNFAGYNNGAESITPVGSMFCIWCDNPSHKDETQIAKEIRMILRVIGARMQNSDIYSASNELVEGGFKADGTINVPTNNKTVGNGSGNTTADNDTVRVTGPNLAALKCETTTVTIQGAAEGKIAAYDVTPSTADNNKYIGEAEVRIKIPEGWDKTKVKAFIVEDGTAKDIDGTATEDGWYVFTAPHFSVMGIYEKAATTEVGETIEIVAGQTGVITVPGDVTNNVGEIKDGTVATKEKVEKVQQPDEKINYSATASASLGEYTENRYTYSASNLIDGDESTYYWSNSNEGQKIGEYAQVDLGAAIPFDAVRIIPTTNHNDAKCTAYVKVSADGSNWTTIGSYDGTETTVLSNTAGNVRYIRVEITAYKQTWWQLAEIQWGSYENGTFTRMAASGSVTTEGKTETQVTIKGIKGGETTIVIDGKTYPIKVVDATLENAEKLYIDFWVTNHRIEPTGLDYKTTSTLDGTTSVANGRNYATFTAGDFYVEEGKLLSDVIPKTGYAPVEGVAALYWKVRYLPHDHRQDRSGWTNKSGYGTDTITGVNGGVDIERIRFYGSKWEYRAVGATDWTEFSGTTADESGNQIVAYYLLKTEVTDEVTTYITDWPDPNNTKNIFGVALDYCVKYESNGTRNPNVFGRKYKSQWFNCQGDGAAVTNGYTLDSSIVGIDSSWEGPAGSQYYRVINNIRGEETADYEIYMITITPSTEYFGSETTYYECPETITYSTEEGAEKVIWAESQDTVDMSGLTQHSELVIGGTPDVKRVLIRRGTGMLITYYVRAKVTEDALTVHYINMKNNDQEFYTYNIAVGAGTLFPVNPESYFGNGVLSNYSVKNKEGNTETIKSDLKELPKIAAQYRYSKFVCVKVKRSEDGKDFYLYYTFDNEVTFVVDFGLPIKVTPIDVNTSLEGKAERVEVTQKDVKYGTVAIEENSVNFTYTLNKMINGYDTIVATYYGTGIDGTEGEVSFNIHIIPATNVYYEDSFAKFTNGSGAAEGATWAPVYDTNITAENNPYANTNQALEALGQTDHNPYGYDPAYQNSTMFSMGSAQKVTVTSDMVTNWTDTSTWPTAQFTFKGTGFDIISLTDNTSGAIFVFVYKGTDTSATGNRVRSHIVDNYYGYKQDENGNWVVDKNASNALYQIPVMRIRDLGYGEYTAVVKVFYDNAFDHTATGNSYSFWLDAVRVYDPMGESVNTGETYKPDGEAYPQYIKLRSELAANNGTVGVNGKLLFIDGKENASISEYANYGPNNEVYLANGQAITFKLNVGNAQIETVQIGAKAPMSGGIAKLSVNGTGVVEKELSSATEMYYDISAVKDGRIVTITNTGEAILSLTNLKITYTEKGSVSLGAMNAEEQTASVMAVRALFAPAPVEPEPEPEPEKTFEPERFEASWSRNVMQGRKATLTVKTSEDVEAITVDGQTIRSYRTRTERMGFGRRAKRITYREFTYSMVAQESADFSVTAINAEGTESKSITARLTVKTRPNSMRDMWDWFKGWF